MKIEMANNSEFRFDCPSCCRIISLDSAALDGLTLVSCPYCGKKTQLPKHVESESDRQKDRFKYATVASPYVIGSARKWRRLISSILYLVTVAGFFVLLSLLGGGKYNGTYFIGVKRTPGFEQSYINLEPATAFGLARMEQSLRTQFSYIIVKYHEKSGPSFFERL